MRGDQMGGEVDDVLREQEYVEAHERLESLVTRCDAVRALATPSGGRLRWRARHPA